MPQSPFSTSLFALVAVMLCIALLPWLVRRWQRRSQIARGVAGVDMQILGTVALGPSQRVVTVQVQREQQQTCLVLGVTGSSISCLHVFDAEVHAEEAHETTQS